MEVAYSVGVSNRFASLMADDDDPGDQIITPPNPPEKVEKKDVKSGKPKNKESREKGQQTRKSVQDSTKQGGEKPQTAGRGGRGGGRQDNRRNHSTSGEEREFYPRGEGRGGRGGRGGRPRLSSRDKENDAGFSGERGFSGGDRGFSGGERGFSGGDRGFSGGDREDRGEGRGRGMGRFRGGRGGSGGRGGFRGKREFERRSGSDKSSVKPVEKREGGGAHNWGKREDVDDWPEDGEEPQVPPVATGQTEGEQNGDMPTADKTEEQTGDQTETTPKESEENQLKEMTLDEYRALKAKSSKEIIKQDGDERKPGENVDSSQWKDTIIYERREGEYFPGTREVIEKPKTSGRIKTTLDANFYFKDPARRGGRGRSGERGGRGRGGEGRGRGRGEGRGRDEGKGRFRGDRRSDHGRAPNVEDTADFPTLPGAPPIAVEQ